ncbi:outer membrane beta-barrel protein [Pontibacter sp. BAB1700]|uniref:outer membrane beta-barrel protein n=1 Tax=Pontibacter sp. BAB1700 TaxID=1144253 RepID=UPI0012DDA2C7|nr:outer membrane beta-barrel protein [Pontibacter sp. BAB1700]
MNSKISCFTFSMLFVLLLGWSSSRAQSRGYIVQGDTVYTDGYIQFDPRKPFQVEYQKSKKSLLETYAAGALTEFGYSDSTKFVARKVTYFGEMRHVFLKTITGGELNLYAIRGENGKQYYFEKNDLTQLTKENLQTNLSQHAANSTFWQRQLPRVRLSEQSLRYYTRNINKGRNARMSMFSFGGIASFNRSTIQIKTEAFPENGFGDYSMTSENVEAGAFVEAPVWDFNNLSIISQLSYGKMDFATALISTSLDQHMKLTLDFLRLSVIPRYYFNGNKVSFYAEGGAELLYAVKQSNKLLEAKHKSNSTSLHEYEDIFRLQKANFGVMAGVGLQYFYLPKNYVSLGLSTGHVFAENYSINNLSTTIRFNL